MIFLSLKNSPTHTFTQVDLLKIDCEGCEFKTFLSQSSIFAVKKYVIQLDLEIHHMSPFTLVHIFNLWKLLLENVGMMAFHKEPNIEFSTSTVFAIEYGLLNSKYVQKNTDTAVHS